MVQINSPKIVQTRANQLNRISLCVALCGDESQQPALALLALLPEHILLLPEVAVNLSPLAVLIGEVGAAEGFVDEVAALAVEAVAVEPEGEAGAGLVGVVVGHVVPQLAGAVGELALVAVGAEALLRVIPAERTLDLRAVGMRMIAMRCFGVGVEDGDLCLLALGGDVQTVVAGLLVPEKGQCVILVEVHKNDYR